MKKNPTSVLFQNKILLRMKLTFLLLLVFSMQITASVSMHGQVTLKMQNESIRDVFKEIETQSPYRFFYNEAFADLNKRININVDDRDINSTLDELLLMSDMSYKVLDNNLVVIAPRKELQQQVVTGQVTDAATGEPLPGASVVIQGTTTGTTTGIDGDYSLSVPGPESVLEITFVGYLTQQILVGNNTVINVNLSEDVRLLDEIIVVGYATQRAGEITGSVSTVTAGRIADLPAVNTSSILRGAASGVTITQSNTPGTEAIVRVRGLGTINNNNPLWVVDGVPGAPVNPEDIESISVLKDASSQAIYGARAANGVILVTTKAGSKNQAPRISVSVRNGINQNISSYDLLNTQEWGEWLWLAAQNQGIENFSHVQYGSGPQPTIPEYVFPARASSVDYSLYDNMMLHEDGTDTYLITKANKEGTDWLQEVTRNATFQQYNFDISGGSDNTNYAFTANYLGEEGVLQYTGFTRYGIRANFDAKLADWLEVGERLNVSYRNFQGSRSDHGQHTVMSYIFRMQPIIPVFDVAGNHAGTQVPGTDNSPSPAFHLWSARNNYNRILSSSGNVYANATILEGLSFNTLFGFNFSQGNARSINYNEVAHAERGLYDGLSENSNVGVQYNWTNTLNYSKSLDNHHFNTILGYEYIAAESRWFNASRTEFFFKDPNYIQLGVGERDVRNDGNFSEWALISQFGRLNYNYQGKYLFQATVRRDGSSRFGQENRYGTFPAFSAGWRLSGEDFMLFASEWLFDLKLRAGWGQAGNDQIGNYNGFTTFRANPANSYYPITGSNTSATSGFRAAAIGDPTTHWETTTTTNIGVDANLFGNLSLTFDLWKRETTNMLYQKAIPDILGRASAPSINIGDMENNGFDFELAYFGGAPGPGLQYDIAFNISRYRNKIIRLSDVAGEFISGAGAARAEAGRAFPEFYGYVVDGIFQTQAEADAHPTAFGTSGTYNQPGNWKFQDVNGDGVINADDQTWIGSPHPDFTAGLDLSLRYRNFRVTTFLYASYGNDAVNWTRRHLDFNIWRGNRSKRALYESWGSPYLANNADAKMPQALISDAGHREMSTYFIEDASYLRMQNLIIGYDFTSLLPNQPFTKIEVYGQVTNLFTITNYSGLDPEIGRAGMGMGLDDGAWPSPRQFMVGVGIGF